MSFCSNTGFLVELLSDSIIKVANKMFAISPDDERRKTRWNTFSIKT